MSHVRTGSHLFFRLFPLPSCLWWFWSLRTRMDFCRRQLAFWTKYTKSTGTNGLFLHPYIFIYMYLTHHRHDGTLRKKQEFGANSVSLVQLLWYACSCNCTFRPHRDPNSLSMHLGWLEFFPWKCCRVDFFPSAAATPKEGTLKVLGPDK